MAVSLSLFAGAGWQFFDNNGNPLSGGLLYTYAAGTTTPTSTYTDSSGTVANTNPIYLNSAGRVPYEIWLTSGTNYKFVLNTSTGTLLGTYDNIKSAATSLDGTGTNNAVTYFNSVGAFSSSPNFTFNDSTNTLTVAGNISGDNISASGNVAATGNLSGVNLTATGTAAITGNTTITGTLAVTGGITSATPAVTQSPSDSSTKIATTAFVQSVTQSSKIQPLTATVGTAGSLNISLATTSLNFRTDIYNTIVNYSNASTITINLPSSATLGTVSGKQARLVVLAIIYSSSIRLAVTNLAGGIQIDETNISASLLTTTTAGTTASSVYSENSAGGAPNGTSITSYRVVGFIDVTYSGGAWGTPVLVQGTGGQALAALSSLGYGQSYNTFTDPGASVTSYNTTGKPQFFALTITSTAAGNLAIYVNSVNIVNIYAKSGVAQGSMSWIVPAGGSWYYTTSGTVDGRTFISLS